MSRNRILPACAILAIVFATGCASMDGAADHLAGIKVVPHESVRHGADDVAALTAIGRGHLREGDNARAIATFERALAAAPRNADALNARAVAFLRIGRGDAAAADLRAAIEAAPDQAHLHSNLGYVLMRDGQYQAAATAMRRGFALDPRNPRLRANWRELVALVERAPDSVASPETAASPEPEISSAARSTPHPTFTSGSAPIATARSPGHQAVHNLHFGPPALAAAPSIPASMTSAASTQSHSRASAATPTPTVHLSTARPGTGDARALSAHSVRPPAGVLRVGQHASLQPVAALSMLAGKARVEVSNGNGVSGFARRTSQSLRQRGARITTITNAAHFRHDTSTVYYRPGHEEEARRIAAALPGPAPALEALETLTRVDVRVVLGADAIGSPERPAKRRIVG